MPPDQRHLEHNRAVARGFHPARQLDALRPEVPVRVTPVHWVTVPDGPAGRVCQMRRIVRPVANVSSVTNWNSLLRKLCQSRAGTLTQRHGHLIETQTPEVEFSVAPAVTRRD